MTTFLNAQRYIAEAIESVLAQSYRNLELILVDDGSTDDSRAIAESFRASSPDKIRILNHPGMRNEGKSASRNLGIRCSSGTIIALLDADDIWLPEKLEMQAGILWRYSNVDFTYGPVLYHYAWTGRPQDQCRDCPSPLGLTPDRKVEAPDILTRMLHVEARRQESICPYPSAVAFRRSLFNRVGGFDADFPRLYDDVMFFAKALAVGRSFISSKVLCKYRLHPGDMLSFSFEEEADKSGGGRSAIDQAERLFLDKTRTFLNHHAIADRRLRLALFEAELVHRYPTAGRVVAVLRRGRRQAKSLVRTVRRRASLASTPPIRLAPAEVHWGDLGKVPLSRPALANSRGGTIGDFYFSEFIARHGNDITGDVAEVGDDVQSRRHASPGGSCITILDPGALIRAEHRDETDLFQCIIAQDLLRYSEDPGATLAALGARLKPGGVMLISIASLAPVDRGVGDRWRFTSEGVRRLFEKQDRLTLTHLEPRGGLWAATAVLHGLGAADLGGEDEYAADAFPVEIHVRAQAEQVRQQTTQEG